MADDKMRNDDLNRNMGGKDDLGKQTPGRKQDDDLNTGGQQGTGQQAEPKHKDDFGTSGQKGTGQGSQGTQGGQNR